MISLTAALLAVLLAAPVARSAEPEQRCEARKLRLAAQNAACRLRKDAAAALQAKDPDYAMCQEGFARQYAKAEEAAGPGVCPTEGDRAEIEAVLSDATREAAEQIGGPDGSCPAGYWDRSPSEVVEDLLLAYVARNEALIACNYHPDASVTTDQGLLIGQAEVVQWYLSLYDLFDGVAFQVVQVDEFRDTVRLLWQLDGGWVVIEDGVDAFVIQRGRIRQQVQHGLISFTGPPPG
jgi:hypothetical protein